MACKRRVCDGYNTLSTSPVEPEGHIVIHMVCGGCGYVWPIAICHPIPRLATCGMCNAGD